MLCQFNIPNKMQNTNDVMEKLNMSMLFGVQLELDNIIIILFTDWVLQKLNIVGEPRYEKC